MDLTTSWVGVISLATFLIGYLLVVTEEFTHLRKSKTMIFAAGLIWAFIAFSYAEANRPHEVEHAVMQFLTEFAELFLFLLVAMTYVNAMSERNVFAALRTWLISRQMSFRRLFWITGVLSFFLSPVIDNLTTALVMSAVVIAVGQDNPRFVSVACINIVVAANAGGAFSPFGDITTLMVWQANILDFATFFHLFVPSLINFLVPAAIMSLTVSKQNPAAASEQVSPQTGRKKHHVVVCMHHHNGSVLPPFSASATFSRHDDRPGLPEVFRLLPPPHPHRQPDRSTRLWTSGRRNAFRQLRASCQSGMGYLVVFLRSDHVRGRTGLHWLLGRCV